MSTPKTPEFSERSNALPCPFCGGAGEVHQDFFWGRESYYIRCAVCWSRVGSSAWNKPEQALKAWNHQAQIPTTRSAADSAIPDPYAVFFEWCDANGFRDVGSGAAKDMNPKRFNVAIAAYAASSRTTKTP